MFEVKTMNGSLRHGEDGRDRVDREDDVGVLDHDEDEEERRGEQAAVDAGQESLAVVSRRDRQHAAHQPQDRIALGVDLLLALEQQAGRR